MFPSARVVEILRSDEANPRIAHDLARIIDGVLPDVADQIRGKEPRFNIVGRLRDVTAVASTQSDSLLLAGLIADLNLPSATTNVVLRYLDPSETLTREVEDLLNGARILRAGVADRTRLVDDKLLRDIAHGLRRPGIVERSRLLADAMGDLDANQHASMIDITIGVQSLLAHPELLDGVDDSLAELRRRQARELNDDPSLAHRIDDAPITHILAHDPDVLVNQIRLLDPAPSRGEMRVDVKPASNDGRHVITVVCRDRKGLLSRLSAALARGGYSVSSASLATWPDDTVLDTFVVSASNPPKPSELVDLFERAQRGRLRPLGLTGEPPRIDLDNSIHPWHSLLRVSGPDRLGLLAALSYALSRAGITVHHAVIQTRDGVVDDSFEVSDRHGRKIDTGALARVVGVLTKISKAATD